jgi:CheY-like chemotaxis protein
MMPEETPTILVVEDYSDSRTMLCSLLRREGYQVFEAASGKQGMLEAERRIPDLILMDLALPEMDGIETVRQIRQIPKLADTPVLVVSAYVTDAVREDALAAGCAEVFSKPLNIKLLLEKVKEVLSSEHKFVNELES